MIPRHKLTDEQWSMVVSAHESGQLVTAGRYDFGMYKNSSFKGAGCFLQIAYNESSVHCAAEYAPFVAGFFDEHYDPMWTADDFIFEMSKICD